MGNQALEGNSSRRERLIRGFRGPAQRSGTAFNECNMPAGASTLGFVGEVWILEETLCPGLRQGVGWKDAGAPGRRLPTGSNHDFGGIRLNRRTRIKKEMAQSTEPSRKGAPGSSKGAPGEVK